MKILLAADRVNSAGIGTVVRGLCRALPPALPPGYQLLLIGGPREPVAGNVIRLRPPRTRDNAAIRFGYEQGVVALMARRAAFVHQTDYRPLLASRRPFLITVHDAAFLDHPMWYPPVVARFKRAMLAAAIAKKPAAIVCGSEYTRRRLVEHHPLAAALDLRVIYPGIEPPAAPGTTDPLDAEPYFLTISTIEARKNHLGLLAAFLRARRHGLPLRWKVAGAPGYGSKQIVRALRSADGVDVLGRVDDGERERLYRGARFVAVPSHVEGFGFPPLEAMARGVPVACARGSAMDETLGDATLWVEPEDTRGWEEALMRLSEDGDERERLRGLGSEAVRRFDWAETAQQYAELYRTVAAGLGGS